MCSRPPKKVARVYPRAERYKKTLHAREDGSFQFGWSCALEQIGSEWTMTFAAHSGRKTQMSIKGREPVRGIVLDIVGRPSDGRISDARRV